MSHSTFSQLPTLLALSATLIGSSAAAQEWTDRPDAYAPIGITGDRMSPVGNWAFSYQHTRTDGSGLLSGRGSLTSGDVFAAGYAAAPKNTVREQHLLSALYGYDQDTSIAITLPWLNNEITMSNGSGGDYNLRSTGMGDLTLTGLFAMEHRDDEKFHLQCGLSLPTGSRDERGATPFSGSGSEKLPYILQLSSGTVDLSPGVTYIRYHEQTSLGAQAIQTLRFTENSDDYQLGNETQLNAWVSRTFRENLSGSLRLGYHHLGHMRGQDGDINPNESPLHDPSSQGGDRCTAYAGLNYTQPGGHSFGFELGGPLWQDLNGPQVEHDISYSLGWRISF